MVQRCVCTLKEQSYSATTIYVYFPRKKNARARDFGGRRDGIVTSANRLLTVSDHDPKPF